MEPTAEILEMLKRQAELEGGMHQPGGLRVTAERDIYLLRERLQRFPQAVSAISAGRTEYEPARGNTGASR